MASVPAVASAAPVRTAGTKVALKLLMGGVAISGAVIAACFRYINVEVLKDRLLANNAKTYWVRASFIFFHPRIPALYGNPLPLPWASFDPCQALNPSAHIKPPDAESTLAHSLLGT